MADPTIESLVFLDENEPEYSEGLTDADRCVRGQPEQRTWHHFTSADDQFFAGYWEADPGCWQVSYTEYEFCQIVSGISILRDKDGNERHLRSGDNFVIPAGFEGQWEVVETTRKIYVIYEP